MRDVESVLLKSEKLNILININVSGACIHLTLYIDTPFISGNYFNEINASMQRYIQTTDSNIF